MYCPYASHIDECGSRRSNESMSTKIGRLPTNSTFSGVASFSIHPSASARSHNSSVSSAAASHCEGVHSHGYVGTAIFGCRRQSSPLLSPPSASRISAPIRSPRCCIATQKGEAKKSSTPSRELRPIRRITLSSSKLNEPAGSRNVARGQREVMRSRASPAARSPPGPPPRPPSCA